MFRLGFLPPNAMAIDIGPTLPKYMVKIIISFPKRLSAPVRLRESPTVAAALTVSNRISSAGAFVTAESSRVDTNITENDITVTATALYTDCFDIVLPKRETLFFPLIRETVIDKSTAAVTVFMPPAVPTGEPPMNISSKERMAVGFVKFSCGRLANPAVLVVTD